MSADDARRERHRSAADISGASQPPALAPARESHEDVFVRLRVAEGELAEVRKEVAAQVKHRARVETVMFIVGGCALAVAIGAFNVRDSVTRLEAGVAAREARIATLESAGARRDNDDRATATAIVRVQTTMETLQSTIAQRLDAIEARLATPAPARAPR